MNRLVCVRDFEEEAINNVLDKKMAIYFMGGADDEITKAENRQAFNRLYIRPRMLRDVSCRDLSTTVLGIKLDVPFGICPMAFQTMAHPDGERATARAAEKAGGIFTLSLFANTSIEEISMVNSTGRKWMQFHILKNRSKTERIIRRAENAGFEAVVVTVDAQCFGKRRLSWKNPWKVPQSLNFPNISLNSPELTQELRYQGQTHAEFEHGLTWEIVGWLKEVTRLAIILKGIQTNEDAKLAAEAGVDAVWISNHGGRQIDTVLPTIEVLPGIVKTIKATGRRCEVYLDSGITKGSDIFKAIALGAKMVFIGKSVIWGLAVGGEEGVGQVLQILKEELDLTMALAGVASIRELNEEYICQRSNL